MLKGYLKCTDISKLLLGYIHFELTKKDMSKVALHLRNCPMCMEKYTKIQKRKKELKTKMYNIEKTIRMQNEISAYIDNEASEDTVFIVEGMLLSENKYRRELTETEELRQLLKKSQTEEIKKRIPKCTEKIIQKIRSKRALKMSALRKIIRLFEPLRHGFAKFE